MNQLDLFAAVRSSDPVTSQVAARSNAEGKRRQRDHLLAALRRRGSATADELAVEVDVPRYIVATRLAVMRRAGEVEVCGIGENAAGRPVQIWRERA